jgi:hypothetical protein
MSSHRLILLATCLFSALPSSSNAAVLNWNNPTGGPFNTATNWLPTSVPTISDSAIFDMSGQTYTISFPTDVTNTQLAIAHDDVTFDLLNHTYDVGSLNLDNATLHLRNGQLVTDNTAEFGPHGNATLTIENSTSLTTGPACLGRFSDGNGTVNIAPGSQWSASSLTLGGDDITPGGHGTLTLDSASLNVTGDILLWPSATLHAYPASISAHTLHLHGGIFSAWGDLNPPVHSTGGTIDVPASKTLSLNGSLTTINAALLQRTGPGTAIISGPQSHEPGAILWARGGDTILNTNAGAPSTAESAAIAPLSIFVGPEPANITLNADQDLHNLTVTALNPGTQGLNLNSPAAPNAFRSLRVYPSTTGKSDLWAAISNADRANAPDPHDGIYDSGLSSHPNSRLGLASLIDPHGDLYFLIRPTRIGDLNLDGVVTISDFIDLSSNFGASGPNITWQEGDLNYDNAVTISDFIDLASNFGASYAGATLPIASAHSSSVPEPSILLLLPSCLLFPRPRTRTERARVRGLLSLVPRPLSHVRSRLKPSDRRPRLLCIVFHPDSPNHFFRSNNPDLLPKPLSTPSHRRIPPHPSLIRNRHPRHVLRLLVTPARLAEIRPGVGDHPVITRQLLLRRARHRLADLPRHFGRSPAPGPLIGVLPDRVARRDNRNVHPAPVFHPERLARAALIRRILENQNPQQPLRLASEYLVRLACVGRIRTHHVEADHCRVIRSHHLPRAPGMPGQQLPTIRPLPREQIGIVIPAAPLDEPVVGRLSRHTIVHRRRAELRQLSEAARPAKRNSAAVGAAPVALVAKKIPLQPLHIIPVGADEADATPPILPIDPPRVKALHLRRLRSLTTGHQHRKIHAPIRRCLNMPAHGRCPRRHKFIPPIPADDR